MQNAGEIKHASTTISHPSRRGLLTGGPAVIIGAAITTAARAINTKGPDAALVALCDDLVAIQTEWAALVNSRHTIEDEKRTDAEVDRLSNNSSSVIDRIYDAGGIRTHAGALAVARASLAIAPRYLDGAVICGHDAAVFAFDVLDFLTRSCFADRISRES